MSGIVHAIDPNAEHMYDSPGREAPYRRNPYHQTDRYHTYGQQLGYHALFMSSGKLLKKCPVIQDRWEHGDPWVEWLRGYGLTRDDGHWLSDGTDRTPLDIKEFLLERKKKDLVITGDRDKVLRQAGINQLIGKEIVVEGDWYSADHVKVSISSALVPSAKANMFARKLVREEPMQVWVPCFYETEDDLEYLRTDKKDYVPWIVCLSGEARLDEYDPYGVYCADTRPHLAQDYSTICKLSREDAFGRVWNNNQNKPVLRAQAWGREDKYSDREDGQRPGTRLFCASSILKTILTKNDAELLILIKLERYEKESHRTDSKFTHTVAVVRVAKDLDLEYYKGRINYVYKSRF